MDALVEAIDQHPCTHHLAPVHRHDNGDGHDDGDCTDSAATECGDAGDGNGGEPGTTASTTPGCDDGATASSVEQNAPPHGPRNNGGADAISQSRWPEEDGRENPGDDSDLAQSPPGDLAQSHEPAAEGEWEVRRSAGVRGRPYPDIHIIVTATLDQLVHARTRATPAGAAGGHPPGQSTLDGLAGRFAGRSGGGFAHAQQGGPVHPATLALLACNARIRRVVLDEHGAVLHLGRGHRLATSTQKAALYARDIGCVIPGCTVPGDLCEVHHVVPWVDGGQTDIDNLVLVCLRHHIEITDGTWEVQMIDGVPWAGPPAWAHPTRPLLRNASHRPPVAA